MTKINGLSARLKSCPVTKHSKSDFFGRLSVGAREPCRPHGTRPIFPLHPALRLRLRAGLDYAFRIFKQKQILRRLLAPQNDSSDQPSASSKARHCKLVNSCFSDRNFGADARAEVELTLRSARADLKVGATNSLRRRRPALRKFPSLPNVTGIAKRHSSDLCRQHFLPARLMQKARAPAGADALGHSIPDGGIRSRSLLPN